LNANFLLFVLEKRGDLTFQKSELLKENAETVGRLFAEDALPITRFVTAIFIVLSVALK
jgi:hypothetical protein